MIYYSKKLLYFFEFLDQARFQIKLNKPCLENLYSQIIKFPCFGRNLGLKNYRMGFQAEIGYEITFLFFLKTRKSSLPNFFSQENLFELAYQKLLFFEKTAHLANHFIAYQLMTFYVNLSFCSNNYVC